MINNYTSKNMSELSVFKTIVDLFKKLPLKRKKQSFFVILVMLFSSIFEIFFLGSFLPFLQFITDPNTFWNLEWVRNIAIELGINSKEQLLLPITSIFILAVVLNAIFSVINLGLSGFTSAAIGTDLSIKCFKKTLYQPYPYHTQSDNSEVATTFTFRISRTVQALNLFFQLISSLIVCIVITICLLFVDFKITILIAISFAFSYFLIKLSVSKKAYNNGRTINKINANQLKMIIDSLNSIRGILINSTQEKYIVKYGIDDKNLRLKNAEIKLIQFSPKFILQAIGIIVITCIAFILVAKENQSSVTIIPLLGTIALGMQRLLPAMQNIFKCWSGIKPTIPAITAVIDTLNVPLSIYEYPQKSSKLNFKEKISLKKVSYKHKEDTPYIIKDVSLDIFKGEKIGIIGSTGSGKSTLIDLIMGLVKPSSGDFEVDNLMIHDSKNPDRLLAWRSNISLVPQEIFLADDSIEANIAFSSSSNKINTKKLNEVAEISHSKEFIEDLAYGFKTRTGSNGVRLSGGQKQRIGLARALYKNHSVLILDEGTSALDNNTEKKVMESIRLLDSNITIIMIAHRLSTLKMCNKVYEIRNGRVELFEGKIK